MEYLKLWKQYLAEGAPVNIGADGINKLQVTSNDNGVAGTMSAGILKYQDEAGNDVTVDLSDIAGSGKIRMGGNVNVDVNSALFTYLADYAITLTPNPDNSGLINTDATLEKLVNNSSDKFIQFVNQAAEDETVLFIRTKSGKYQMLYLNVIERKK
jgi:hypothetical protein